MGTSQPRRFGLRFQAVSPAGNSLIFLHMNHPLQRLLTTVLEQKSDLETVKNSHGSGVVQNWAQDLKIPSFVIMFQIQVAMKFTSSDTYMYEPHQIYEKIGELT